MECGNVRSPSGRYVPRDSHGMSERVHGNGVRGVAVVLVAGAAPNHIMAMRRAIPSLLLYILWWIEKLRLYMIAASRSRHLPMKLQSQTNRSKARDTMRAHTSSLIRPNPRPPPWF
jgi:hypothetical protein